ncbi:uncharacterized protein BX663DRAFT_543717 [Cokeromyces recurvatus]|uniref:uncharacterized protein n=1 Tax=Cokeromyces recurvatus TaxID=90255 RepID=UPI002220E4A6|nr:uncharacterized protein BX663DRAFT_543717 [Cokeromyces recurvatus]KAI7901772.1 hypothetical protein BX663DRAFT_543717 [Cokeromyces recurvatus]
MSNEYRSGIIKIKKEMIFNNLLVFNEANAKCTDCEEVGHFNKNYYKCKFYKGAAADDGTAV